MNKWYAKGKIDSVKIIKNENGDVRLDIPDTIASNLPPVSIVTITKDRSKFAGLMLYNWNSYKYPPEKLEWVIVDDSQDPKENLAQYLPIDSRINYIKLKEWMPVAAKRNFAIEKTKYDIICFNDDDDIYDPMSIVAKVRTLEHYKKDVCFSAPFGVYDLMQDTSYIFDIGIDKFGKESNAIAEAGLAFRKRYWRKNKFSSTSKNGTGEGPSFIKKNFSFCIKIPFMFNFISLTHSVNITGQSRRFHNVPESEKQKAGDFKKIFSPDLLYILENTKQLLLQN